MKVLLVHGKELDPQPFGSALVLHGHEFATSGRAGYLDALTEELPDVLIMDIFRHEKPAMMVVDEVRALSRDIRIVALGRGECPDDLEFHENFAFAMGADAMLPLSPLSQLSPLSVDARRLLRECQPPRP